MFTIKLKRDSPAFVDFRADVAACLYWDGVKYFISSGIADQLVSHISQENIHVFRSHLLQFDHGLVAGTQIQTQKSVQMVPGKDTCSTPVPINVSCCIE